MRLKILKGFSSPIHGNCQPGEVHDFTPNYGRHLVERGIAEECGEEKSLPAPANKAMPPPKNKYAHLSKKGGKWDSA